MSANSSADDIQLPIDQELVLKVIPMPGDCNANGDIFGGWVMAQVDLAGSVVPVLVPLAVPGRLGAGKVALVSPRLRMGDNPDCS